MSGKVEAVHLCDLKGWAPLTRDWLPLSRRNNEDLDAGALYEGVPGHLRAPLLHWLELHLTVLRHDLYSTQDVLERERSHELEYVFTEPSDRLALRIASRAEVHLAMPRHDEFERSKRSRLERGRGLAHALLRMAEKADETSLLDIIDAAVGVRLEASEQVGREVIPDDPSDLDALLRDGGSAYCLNSSGTALERRVDATVTELFNKAVVASGEPSRHLKAAWQAAYGMHPNPNLAYAEAVLAIEAATIPAVLNPSQVRATLGDVLRRLSEDEQQWALAIPDNQRNPARIDPLIQLMRLVWHGHRSRHAGTPTTGPVTAEAAEMALHAAAMIVYWIARDGLRRR